MRILLTPTSDIVSYISRSSHIILQTSHSQVYSDSQASAFSEDGGPWYLVRRGAMLGVNLIFLYRTALAAGAGMWSEEPSYAVLQINIQKTCPESHSAVTMALPCRKDTIPAIPIMSKRNHWIMSNWCCLLWEAFNPAVIAAKSSPGSRAISSWGTSSSFWYLLHGIVQGSSIVMRLALATSVSTLFVSLVI